MHQENKEIIWRTHGRGQRKACELPQKCHSTTQEDKSDTDVLERIMLTAVLSLVLSCHCWIVLEPSSSAAPKNANTAHNIDPDKDCDGRVICSDHHLTRAKEQNKDCQGHASVGSLISELLLSTRNFCFLFFIHHKRFGAGTLMLFSVCAVLKVGPQLCLTNSISTIPHGE